MSKTLNISTCDPDFDPQSRVTINGYAFHPGSGSPGGWVVGNADGTRWRAWNDCGPCWVEDRDKATRYARREDAEAVHLNDEDCWTIQAYCGPAPEAAAAGPDATQYALGLLTEEAGEVLQTIGKALRFGLDSPGPNGRTARQLMDPASKDNLGRRLAPEVPIRSRVWSAKP